MARRWIVTGLLHAVYFLAAIGVVFAAIELPEKLKDVPTYPGSKIQQVMDYGLQCMVVCTVKAGGDAVVDFYKQSLQTKGWKVVAQVQDQDSQGATFSRIQREERQVIQLTVGKPNAQGMIEYQLIYIGER
jgi:hypothetical protein